MKEALMAAWKELQELKKEEYRLLLRKARLKRAIKALEQLTK